MTVSRDKFLEVHARAGADASMVINDKFIARVNEYLGDVKQKLNDGSIGTLEDAAEHDLVNKWYKALVPFISKMNLDSAPVQASFFKGAFNEKTKAEYTADDFRTLEMAHESAFNKIYANVMNTASQLHETLVAQAMDKAAQLSRQRMQEEGGSAEIFRRETASRFLKRLDGLMVELHDIVMPDMTSGSDDDFSGGRKGPFKNPKGPRF